MITQAPRGTQDWYGQDMHRRTVLEGLLREMCQIYNIKEISTPIFEHTNLFERSVGETTDVVQKEMYTFQDKGGRSITLKPEGTAGAIRAYLEHNMYAQMMPTKLFYITPAFRYERPASGRLRQHHQFGVEFVGSPNPMVEVELIAFITRIIKKIGLQDVKLHINSIGCSECRTLYNEALLKFLHSQEEVLCATCKERMTKNPLRVLDCKTSTCQEILQNAPTTLEYLDEECKNHFEQLKGYLDSLEMDYVVDTKVVRGLDYYTKTVFEFINSEGFTLCGGGRYDNLIKEIHGKQEIPSAGFGMGIERILYFLDKENVQLPQEKSIEIYVGVLGEEYRAQAYRFVMDLRNKGIIAETDYMNRSLKAQMKYANNIKADTVLILGENEIKTGKVKIKIMSTGNEMTVKLDDVALEIMKIRKMRPEENVICEGRR